VRWECPNLAIGSIRSNTRVRHRIRLLRLRHASAGFWTSFHESPVARHIRCDGLRQPCFLKLAYYELPALLEPSPRLAYRRLTLRSKSQRQTPVKRQPEALSCGRLYHCGSAFAFVRAVRFRNREPGNPGPRVPRPRYCPPSGEAAWPAAEKRSRHAPNRLKASRPRRGELAAGDPADLFPSRACGLSGARCGPLMLARSTVSGRFHKRKPSVSVDNPSAFLRFRNVD